MKKTSELGQKERKQVKTTTTIAIKKFNDQKNLELNLA